MTPAGLRKFLPLVSFMLIALVLLMPLFAKGYVLILDMIFTDVIPTASHMSSDYFFWIVLQLASELLSVDVIQKAILVTFFVVAGLGMYRLYQYLSKDNSINVYAAYLAGISYIFNPFVYSRIMAGQYPILLGYALLPFYIRALLKLFNSSDWKQVLYIAILLALIGIVSFPTLGICVVISLPIIAYQYYRHKSDLVLLKAWSVKLIGTILMFSLLSSNWLIPLLLKNGETSEAINGFTGDDFVAFSTNSGDLGVIGNVLGGQGFWADAANLYLIPQDIYWWWWIPIVMLWILVGIGFYRGWRTMKGLSIAFVTMFAMAVVLAAGTSGSIFAPINEWLVANVPFFAGYREPQKFVAIVVLVYAIFGALGVEQIIQWLRGRKLANWYINTLAVSLLIIPIATAPLMLWGFGGQLKTSEYPREWYAMNTYLEETVPKDTKILALPWHLYMRFDFAGRIIANPMDKFFAPELVISNDPEFDGAKAYASTDTQTKLDSAILVEAPTRTDLGKRLADLDIEYVLLAKEFDYEKYDYLDKQTDLELVKEDASLKLYKVKTGGN